MDSGSIFLLQIAANLGWDIDGVLGKLGFCCGKIGGCSTSKSRVSILTVSDFGRCRGGHSKRDHEEVDSLPRSRLTPWCYSAAEERAEDGRSTKAVACLLSDINKSMLRNV